MSPVRRRTVAGALAAVLVIALSVVAALRPVPYVTFSAGPTVNVLGENAGRPIISVTGHPVYRDGGALRLLTVIVSGPQDTTTIPQLMLTWINPKKTIFPFDAIYGAQDTSKAVRQQSTQQMDTSQSDAVAAALGALKIRYTTYAQIDQVESGGPADGKLRTGDRIVSANGTTIRSLDQLTGVIRPLPIGSRVTFVVRRDGKQLTERMRTTKSPSNPKASAVLVTIAPGYDFPFPVKLNIDSNIGGPSGGLMFSMAIYDVLTPGSLTGGQAIAGTGEIDANGDVSPIGGIQQKEVAAQAAGARLFLAPADNCAEALGGDFDPHRMRLVKVTNLSDALADVKAWVKDPHVSLPRCTR